MLKEGNVMMVKEGVQDVIMGVFQAVRIQTNVVGTLRKDRIWEEGSWKEELTASNVGTSKARFAPRAAALKSEHASAPKDGTGGHRRRG